MSSFQAAVHGSSHARVKNLANRRLALSGDMDWCLVWNGHFPESEKYFSEAEISRKILEIPQKERFFAKFQALKFENSEPEKMQFHTPSHSITPRHSITPTRLPPINWEGCTNAPHSTMSIPMPCPSCSIRGLREGGRKSRPKSPQPPKPPKPSQLSLGTVFCRTSKRRARCNPEPSKPPKAS